jgi:glutamate-ammonia-ligase adenylyltransferase
MDVAGPDRLSTVTARLVRHGFADSAAASALIDDLDGGDDLVDALAGAADPDLAVTSLRRLIDAAPDRRKLAAAIDGDAGFRAR